MNTDDRIRERASALLTAFKPDLMENPGTFYKYEDGAVFFLCDKSDTLKSRAEKLLHMFKLVAFEFTERGLFEKSYIKSFDDNQELLSLFLGNNAENSLNNLDEFISFVARNGHIFHPSDLHKIDEHIRNISAHQKRELLPTIFGEVGDREFLKLYLLYKIKEHLDFSDPEIVFYSYENGESKVPYEDSDENNFSPLCGVFFNRDLENLSRLTFSVELPFNGFSCPIWSLEIDNRETDLLLFGKVARLVNDIKDYDPNIFNQIAAEFKMDPGTEPPPPAPLSN